MLTGADRRRARAAPTGRARAGDAARAALVAIGGHRSREFLTRNGAFLVLLFILLHKIGDTLGQLVLRLLLDDMGFSNDEIAIWDVGVGFWALI